MNTNIWEDFQTFISVPFRWTNKKFRNLFSVFEKLRTTPQSQPFHWWLHIKTHVESSRSSLKKTYHFIRKWTSPEVSVAPNISSASMPLSKPDIRFSFFFFFFGGALQEEIYSYLPKFKLFVGFMKIYSMYVRSLTVKNNI